MASNIKAFLWNDNVDGIHCDYVVGADGGNQANAMDQYLQVLKAIVNTM